MAASKTSSKKDSADKDYKAEYEKREELKREVVIWLTIAVSILLMISNFNLGGMFGRTISSILFGLFGLIAYIFPILLLVGCFFGISNKWSQTANLKILFSVVFAIFLCMFLSLIVNEADVVKPTAAFATCSKDKNGGGFVGASLAYICVPLFGLLGAYIIDFIVMIIAIILLTGKSLLKPMKHHGTKMYNSAKDKNFGFKDKYSYDDSYDEANIIDVDPESDEGKNKSKKRQDNKVLGVSKNTTIEKKVAGISEEMGEIHIENYPDLNVKDEKKTKLSSDTELSNSDIKEKEPKAFEERVNISGHYAGSEVASDSQSVDFANDIPVEEVSKKKLKASDEEIKEAISEVAAEIENAEPVREYVFPPLNLLKSGENKAGTTKDTLESTAHKLTETLEVFGVSAQVKNISCGPAVTRYELQPELGVKVSKIVGLADDIKLSLAAADVRIEAPIPGKSLVGIEIPNETNVTVAFRDLIEDKAYQKFNGGISFAVGKDISGKTLVSDISKMPHLLIAGATGSGKSVCINTIIMSILYKYKPDEVKLMMIDPKVVELSVYNGIPHLLIPVVTDPKKASGALNWAVQEMTERYEKFAENKVREINGYNELVDKQMIDDKKLQRIVIIVDELADLMMVASKEVEEAICRLAQLARAAGIHLIIATQRPSVNVITGLIKANMPSRIAFAVTSGVDSRTILDMAGAEKLLGKGDMLFDPQGSPKPQRVQGAFISDSEVQSIVDFIRQNNVESQIDNKIIEKIDSMQSSSNIQQTITAGDENDDGRDNYFFQAAEIIVDKEKASIGMLQRYLKIGFNRAARIMDQLEEAGVVGPEVGTKPRTVLMTAEDLQAFVDENQ